LKLKDHAAEAGGIAEEFSKLAHLSSGQAGGIDTQRIPFLLC